MRTAKSSIKATTGPIPEIVSSRRSQNGNRDIWTKAGRATDSLKCRSQHQAHTQERRLSEKFVRSRTHEAHQKYVPRIPNRKTVRVFQCSLLGPNPSF